MDCVLSKLEIPKGKSSIEHIAPKHWLPVELYSLNENKAPAIKVFNFIKSDLFLCQWYDQRIALCYKAIDRWHIKTKDKQLVAQGIDNFRHLHWENPCSLCVCYGTEYCIRQR